MFNKEEKIIIIIRLNFNEVMGSIRQETCCYSSPLKSSDCVFLGIIGEKTFEISRQSGLFSGCIFAAGKVKAMACRSEVELSFHWTNSLAIFGIIWLIIVNWSIPNGIIELYTTASVKNIFRLLWPLSLSLFSVRVCQYIFRKEKAALISEIKKVFDKKS